MLSKRTKDCLTIGEDIALLQRDPPGVARDRRIRELRRTLCRLMGRAPVDRCHISESPEIAVIRSEP